MININENFLNLQDSYLFSTVAKKVAKFQKNNPDKRVIKLGIGDVTRPLVPAVIDAMHKAVDEMGNPETFRGYGPEQGYGFLREKIAEFDYKARGVIIDPDEIFISDGAKCDCGNIGDILGIEATGYLNNHETRKIDKTDIITSEEAAKLANENLNIENTRLSIIPTE